jgi:two-component system, cell cycle sensor histidine kinase and response regulator CckA
MARTNRATILIVDDEEAVRTFAGAALGAAGYRVIVSKSGWESLSICREHDGPIDLAVLDVVMPGMNGGELYKQLLQLIPNIPTLFMSGYPSNDIASYGISTGSTQFLQKPFTASTLVQRSKEILDGKAASKAAL